MESGQAPPPSYQAGPEIPVDIFQPLLAIAQRQYDANDVRNYYLTMLRHLRRMGASNADAAYSLMTPVSDRKDSEAVSEAVSEAETTGDSRKQTAVFEEPAFEPSYEPGRHDQLHISDQQHHDAPFLGEPHMQSQINSLSRHGFLPQTVYTPPADAHQRSAAIPQATEARQYGVINLQSSQLQWAPSPESLDMGEFPPALPPRFAPALTPSPVPHHMHLSYPPPNHIPNFYPPPQQQLQHPQYYSDEPETFLGPLGNSLGLSQLTKDLYSSAYLPMIDVIPSRQRRKQLQKGVRRITQGIPLPLQRQGSWE